jgi:hypothetical protein
MGMKRKKDPIKYCQHCGMQYTRKFFKKRLEDRDVFLRRKYCSLACANSKKGAITRDGYSKRAIKHLKRHCEACGHNRSLCAHHIDQDIENNKEENIQTLCMHCHNFWHTTAKRCGANIAGKMNVLDIGSLE